MSLAIAYPRSLDPSSNPTSLGSLLNHQQHDPLHHPQPQWDPSRYGATSDPPVNDRLASVVSVASGLPTPSLSHSPPDSLMSTVGSPTTTSSAHQHLIIQQPPTQPYNREFPPPLAPRHWTVLKEVGDGSFGTVWLADWHSALNLPPGTQLPGPSSRPEYKGKQLVAIKRMKKAFDGGWDECMKLKELKSLRQIPMHPNIIPLYDAFLLPSTRELYFVFECMEGNLYQLTKSRKGRPLASGLTASIFYQILAGLNHVHVHGYFHRDLKPENLLITTTGLADYPASSLFALPGTPPEKDVVVVVKLADFGLAREITSKPPYTEYVSTRWYRAPEVLLRSRDYSVPVDMWALGTIMVEVLTLKPLFPGDSEVDQVYKICEVLGDPSTEYGVDERGRKRGGGTWSRGMRMAKDVGFAFPKFPPRNFAALFDQNVVSVQLIDCIADLLRYEPKARLTTQQCLDHAYFREVAYRFTPYAPPQTHQQLPTPAASHSSRSHYGSSASVNTAGLPIPPSQASSRSLPPSHSHSTQPGSFRLPYPQDSNGQALPSPDHFSRPHGQTSVPIGRTFSVSSSHSNLSGLVQVQAASGPSTADQQAVLGYPSPVPSATWNGHGEPAWGQPVQAGANSGLMPMPAFGRRGSLAPSLAPSVAASTYYDGSIFEGIAPSRASSVMSFPVSYGGPPAHASVPSGPVPSLRSPSLFSDLSPQQSRVDSTAGPSSAAYGTSPTAASFLSSSPTQQHDPQSPVSESPQLSRSGRWGLFGNNGEGKPNSLKRSPSNASLAGAASIAPSIAPSAAPGDKKSRKEAEKLVKEQEKAARIAKEQAARERARAVMKKKGDLMQSADPLHNFAARGGKAGPGEPAGLPGPTALEKGKGRALPSDRMVQQRMPQIIEDTGRLYVSPGQNGSANPVGSSGSSFLANRFKARRRDDDDDVHSVSSNETGHSSQHWPFPVSSRGRAFSISSKATSASDPEQRRHRLTDFPTTDMDPLARVSSISSMPGPSASGSRSVGGSAHRFPSYGGHYTAPSTGHSSLDAGFISTMQGLATTSSNDVRHLPFPPPSASSVTSGHRPESLSRQRLASPHHERFSPYMLPSAHAPRSPGATVLPPISSFDQAQHPMPRSVMPSYFTGAGPSNLVHNSEHAPMDADPPLPPPQLPFANSRPNGELASPVSATFPFQTGAAATATGQDSQQLIGGQVPHHLPAG
ncbi:hypothetical protein JCM11641_002259 [Rhodosporidiobolus odoratus]